MLTTSSNSFMGGTGYESTGMAQRSGGAINGVKYNQKNLTQTVKRPNLIKIPVSPLPTALAGNVMQSVVSVREFPFLAFKPTDRRL